MLRLRKLFCWMGMHEPEFLGFSPNTYYLRCICCGRRWTETRRPYSH